MLHYYYIHFLLQKKKITKKYILYNRKYYCLSMIPYPSGSIHIGHIRNYIIGDSIFSYKSFKKINVFQPVGWDSFGLPAENAARNKYKKPYIWTYQNIKQMKLDFKILKFSYNWKNEILTADIKYYRFEQLLFIFFYKKDYLAQNKSVVNWDSQDKTILSNEQVIDGKGWRSKIKIKKKIKKQWFFLIKNYSNVLYFDLNKLNNGWPGKVLLMQKNWINRHFFLHFYIKKYYLIIFFNTFFIIDLIINVSFKNILYYLQKLFFLRLTKILMVIKKIKYNSLFLSIHKDINVILFLHYVSYIKKIKKQTKYNIRNWSISRQRYWGCPIPITYCKKCGLHVNNNHPIKLPISFGKNFLLKKFYKFYIQKCSFCLLYEKKELDTLDTFVESSWYYLRYNHLNLSDKIVAINKVNYWGAVNKYIGGVEHAILHLLYARFMLKLFKALNLIYSEIEPFSNLTTQGMVLLNGLKMSKSTKNIINLGKIFNSYYCINSLKLFVLFSAPVDKCFNWTESGMDGIYKFFQKVSKDLFQCTKYILFKDNFQLASYNLFYKHNIFLNYFVSFIFEINFQFNLLFFNLIISNIMKNYKIIQDLNNNILVSQVYILLYSVIINLVGLTTTRIFNYKIKNTALLINSIISNQFLLNYNKFIIIKYVKNNKNCLIIRLKEILNKFSTNNKILRLSSFVAILLFKSLKALNKSLFLL